MEPTKEQIRFLRELEEDGKVPNFPEYLRLFREGKHIMPIEDVTDTRGFYEGSC